MRFAWLNTDAASVEAYDRDPLCGFLFTVHGFQALRSLLIDVYSPRGWAKPSKNVPILETGFLILWCAAVPVAANATDAGDDQPRRNHRGLVGR